MTCVHRPVWRITSSTADRQYTFCGSPLSGFFIIPGGPPIFAGRIPSRKAYLIIRICCLRTLQLSAFPRDSSCPQVPCPRRAGEMPHHLISPGHAVHLESRRWCRRRGIRHRLGALRKDGSLAVIERGIPTIKNECTRGLAGTPDEIYFHRRLACRAPRFEPRPRWPRRSICAAPDQYRVVGFTCDITRCCPKWQCLR